MKGRASSSLAHKLREDIASGRLSPQTYLLPERKLAQANGVAPITARRALKMLEAEGLVSAEPRKGYRVMPKANDPERGAPMAFVLAPHSGTETWDAVHMEKVASLQNAATELGWTFMAVGSEGRESNQVMDQLREARAFGAIIDAKERDLFDAAEREGLPALAIDEWQKDLEVDAVVQDGFKGGMLAARYLLDRGCRRIAWLGSMGTGRQSLERYGGALSVLNAEDIEIPRKLRKRLRNPEDPEGVRKAKEMLSAKDRPDGVLALWQGCTASLAKAARELGLTPGRDFEMVGWSTEKGYATGYVPRFAGGPVPPAITWDVETMGRTAVSRLAERRMNRDLPGIKLKVPVRLRHQE